MALEEIAIPPEIELLQEAGHRQGHTLVMVAIDGQLAGVIELQAALRPEAKAVMAALRQLPQIHSIMIVSGDQPAPTQRLAKELGVTTYFAEVLPTGKAALIISLQQEGRRVCYIGDGINDAIALKAANVSISMRGATTAATDTAHIVLMDESLQQLLPLFELVQRFDANMRNTIWAILGPGAVGLVGIYFFGFGLAHMTVLDHVGLSLGTSIAMASRLRRVQQNCPTPALPRLGREPSRDREEIGSPPDHPFPPIGE
jgi:Cu2+-exporting ATPase